MTNTELFTICHPKITPVFGGSLTLRRHGRSHPPPHTHKKARDLHSRGHLSKKQRYR